MHYYLIRKNLHFEDGKLINFNLKYIGGEKTILFSKISIKHLKLSEVKQRSGDLSTFQYKFIIDYLEEEIEFIADIASSKQLLHNLNIKKRETFSNLSMNFYSSRIQNYEMCIYSNEDQIQYFDFIGRRNQDDLIFVNNKTESWMAYYPYILLVIAIYETWNTTMTSSQSLIRDYVLIYIIGIILGILLILLPLWITHYRLKNALDVINATNIKFVALRKYHLRIIMNFIIVFIIMWIMVYNMMK